MPSGNDGNLHLPRRGCQGRDRDKSGGAGVTVKGPVSGCHYRPEFVADYYIGGDRNHVGRRKIGLGEQRLQRGPDSVCLFDQVIRHAAVWTDRSDSAGVKQPGWRLGQHGQRVVG